MAATKALIYRFIFFAVLNYSWYSYGVAKEQPQGEVQSCGENCATEGRDHKITHPLLKSSYVIEELSKLSQHNAFISSIDPQTQLAFQAEVVAVLGEGKEGCVFELSLSYQKKQSEGSEKRKFLEPIIMKKYKKDRRFASNIAKLSETRFISRNLDKMQAFAPRYFAADDKAGVIFMQKVSLLEIKNQKLQDAKAYKIVVGDLLEALAQLHAHDFTHNDIKVDNVGFDGKRWRLIDFGTAQNAQIAAIGKPAHAAKGYMGRFVKSLFLGRTYPPQINQRNDLRAFGILMIELRYQKTLLESLEQGGYLTVDDAQRLRGKQTKTANHTVRIHDGEFLLQEIASQITLEPSPFKVAMEKFILAQEFSSDPFLHIAAKLMKGEYTAAKALARLRALRDS